MRCSALAPRLAALTLGLGLIACEAAVDPLELGELGELGELDELDEPPTACAPSCPEDPSRFDDPLPLVEAQAWHPAAASDDPLHFDRPIHVDCPAAAWGPELGGLEVQTGTCNYFYATQTSLARIEPGDALQVVVFHDRLDAPEPAEGHVAILLDDEVVWEDYVEIPSDAQVLEARWLADRGWPAGTRVGLHLHNHGYNAWTMLELNVAPATVASPPSENPG